MASIKQRTRIICIFLLLQLLGGTPSSYALAAKKHRIYARGLSGESRHNEVKDERNGVGNNTDFTATPSGNPSASPTSTPTSTPSGNPSANPTSTPTSTPSETPSSIPSSVPSSIPSAAPSSIPSQQPSSEPTETPECTLNDSGEFSVTSDGVGEDGTGAVSVRFAYELVTIGGNVVNLIGGIQSALGSIVLSSLFNGCPLVGGADRRRTLLSDDISESLTAFTSNPADEVDIFGTCNYID